MRDSAFDYSSGASSKSLTRKGMAHEDDEDSDSEIENCSKTLTPQINLTNSSIDAALLNSDPFVLTPEQAQMIANITDIGQAFILSPVEKTGK